MPAITKGLKFIGIGVAALITVLLLAAVAIVVLVDPNDYRDDITQAVHQATGRELKIEGDLKLSLFPWLGLSLGETRLSNAAGFGDAAFAQVGAVDIKLKLLPLLQQRIEMKTLRLHGLHVNLSRAADGHSNWDDLLMPPAEKPVEKPTAGTESPALPLAALAIGGVAIEDAQIRWDDQQAGQKIEVTKFNLGTGPISFGAPIDIQLSTELSLAEPAVQTPIKLQGRVTVDPQTQRYRVEGLDVAVNVRSDLLPVSPLNARLTGNIDADLTQQTVQIDALQVQALAMTTKAKLTVQKMLAAPQAEGQLSIVAFSPRDLAKTLGIALPETTDTKVLNKAEVQLAFSGTPDAVSVKQLAMTLDDSHLTGNMQVGNFTKPAVRFELKLDAIDVDRYLPPAAKAPPPSPAGAAAASAQLPLDMLRGLDVKGDFGLGSLKVANARLADVVLGLTAKGGQLRLSPAKAALYEGQYSGNVALDVRQDTPRLSADEKLSAVKIGPLLKDVLGDDKVSGTASLAAKVTARGVTPEAITGSLNGSADFQFRDGAVKGVNLGQLIREAYAKIKGKPAPPKSTNTTDFAEVTGSVKIRDGVVYNDDLQAKSPLLRIGGKGSIDLPKQRIDYLLNASIVETDQGQAGKELAELKAVTIPVKVTGSFDKPKITLDLAPILKAKAKAAVEKEKTKLKAEAKEKIEEKKAKVKKKLEDKLKEKFKGLF